MPGGTGSRLVTLILLGYAFLCAILIGLIVFLANSAGWNLETTSTIETLLWFLYSTVLPLLLGVVVYRFARFIEAVALSDRRIALVQFMWVYFPALVAAGFWWCGWILGDVDLLDPLPGLGPTFLESALRWLILIASVTWILVSAPIARLWATSNAEDPKAILSAEEHLLLKESQREIEAQVSIPTYYALILSILAISFLIIEAFVGEMFERLTGISGFFGATVAALGVAGLLYPIRRRVSAFVARMEDEATTSSRADTRLAVKSAIASTTKYFFSSDHDDSYWDEMPAWKYWLNVLLLVVLGVVFFSVIMMDFPQS